MGSADWALAQKCAGWRGFEVEAEYACTIADVASWMCSADGGCVSSNVCDPFLCGWPAALTRRRLPYVAQGAAQGLEDGAALATALGLMSGKEELGRVLEVYESVRKERAERIQASADATQKALHLPDGVEQRERDRLMKLAGDKAARNPDMWNDDKWQRFMWGHDVVEETLKEWERKRVGKLGARL